jgi:hypothetical protein
MKLLAGGAHLPPDAHESQRDDAGSPTSASPRRVTRASLRTDLLALVRRLTASVAC